jgi:hypothetical protein
MSLWSAFGELWGWMSDDKPDAGDIFPQPDVMARNGGTGAEGAFENFWSGGYEIYETDEGELDEDFDLDDNDDGDDDDWEDE